MMVGRKEQSIQFIRDSCPYPGRYLSSNSASGVDEYLNQYLNRCGIIPTEMHLYPDEEFSVIMTPLQGLLAENPNLAWGIIGRLGELRCHFPPEGKMRIVRMALEQEGVKIYSRPAVQDIAESAARQIVEFAPFPHREDFTALLSSFMHPEQDLARGLKTLSPNGFARHEECLLLALEKVREFYDSLGALVAKEHFPDNFLELVDSLRDLVKMLRRDNTSSLHLPMGLFLTIVDYIQEPDKLRNLQAYVNQATGKFLGDISEAAMILTVLEKEKIEGRVHLLGWHEVNNFVDKEETDKRFPGVVEALSKIKWIDSHVYQISFKGKEYVVIKVTVAGKTKVCLAELNGKDNAMVAAAAEQIIGFAERVSSYPIDFHIHFLRESKMDNFRSAGRSLGTIFFVTTPAALEYGNTLKGRKMHGDHELGHLSLRRLYPNVHLGPFPEEGLLYALMRRPDLGLLEWYSSGQIPDVYAARYGYWKTQGYYSLAWLTFAHFLQLLEMEGLTAIDLLQTMQNQAKELPPTRHLPIPLDVDLRLFLALQTLLPSLKQSILATGNLSLVTVDALSAATEICQANLKLYEELRGKGYAEAARRTIAIIEKNRESFYHWCQKAFEGYKNPRDVFPLINERFVNPNFASMISLQDAQDIKEARQRTFQPYPGTVYDAETTKLMLDVYPERFYGLPGHSDIEVYQRWVTNIIHGLFIRWHHSLAKLTHKYSQQIFSGTERPSNLPASTFLAPDVLLPELRLQPGIIPYGGSLFFYQEMRAMYEKTLEFIMGRNK